MSNFDFEESVETITVIVVVLSYIVACGLAGAGIWILAETFVKAALG